MRNILPFARRWTIAPALIVVQILATSILLLAAPQDYSDQQGSSYDPSQSAGQQDYGYQQGGSQQPSMDSLRQRCAGPDAGPECAQFGATGSGVGGGVPQIYSNDEQYRTGRTPVQTGRYPYVYGYGNRPQPPTEFQRLVYDSVGQRLTIFGSNLFANVPTTFAPLDRAPVPADYVIGPGDELLIRGWGQVDINVRAQVDRSGNIYIPKVGEVGLTGVKYSELVPYLKGVISRTFRNFDLNVSMGQLRSIQVFVVGQARRPGSYTVSSLTSLVNAVFVSGGPSPTGSLRQIQLRRGDKVVANFDLYDLLLSGDKSKDVTLLPGDVIFIPPVGAQVAIIGSVNNPAIYELRGNTTLDDAVKLAGGFTAVTNNNKATVERVEKADHQTFRNVEEFLLNDGGLAKELRNGDIVRIAPMLPRFEKTITLRGNVAWPGRYPWHEGMRVRDLIPNREALLTRDFWRRQNPVYSASGEVRLSPAVPYSPRTDDTFPRGTGTDGQSRAQTGDQQNTGRQSGPTYNPNYQPQYRPQDLIDPYADPSDSSSTPSANYSNIDRTGQDGPSDPQSNTMTGQTRFRNDIKAMAPEINWDYAVVQRVNEDDLSTKLIPFNLGKAILENDESQNLVLDPGDVITIFSQQDIKVPIEKQAKFVRLEGEFAASGVYRVQPGETLRQLVQRTGGLTPKAYLFGSEFTRESTKERQEKELDRIVRDLELQVERNATTSAGKVVSGEEAASLSTQLEGQRRLVEKLRQIRPTGRLVLDLPGPSATLADVPDIALEDGDRFVVPYRPASVEVLGSVYNANAFIWKSDKRMGDYLKAAGGPNRDADKKHIFVLRADGAVVSNASMGSFWSGGLDSYRLEPGDAVIVPENLDKTSTLKGLKDWTQVFSQLALGAAAINVLK